MDFITPPTHINVGVLLVDTVELLDVAPVDLFGILSASYLKSRKLPDSISSLAPSVSIVYISQDHDNSLHTQIQPCSADAAIRTTRSLNSDDVAPGKLDILVIPGPPPWAQITPEVGAFVRGHAAQEHTTIMTVCVGVYVAAQAGIVEGKNVTGPARYLPDLEKRFKANWVERRWMSDGNIWTSGVLIRSPKAPYSKFHLKLLYQASSQTETT